MVRTACTISGQVSNTNCICSWLYAHTASSIPYGSALYEVKKGELMILLLGGRMIVFWKQDMALLIVIYIIALHQGYTYESIIP